MSKKDDKVLTPKQLEMVNMLLECVPEGMTFQLRIGEPPRFLIPGDHDCDFCMHKPCDCPLEDNEN